MKDLDKFKQAPTSLSFSKIEKILLALGFEKPQGKGCHIIFSRSDLVFSVSLHGKYCKYWQKKAIFRTLKDKNFI